MTVAPGMQITFNWVDWLILLVSWYFLFTGWETGLVYLAGNLVSVGTSLFLAVRFHTPVGMFLMEKFGIQTRWTAVLGYLIVGFISYIVFEDLIRFVIQKFPRGILRSKVNKWLGAVVSALNGVIIITFFLLISLALPLRGTVKDDIDKSRIAGYLVSIVEQYGGPVASTLDIAAKEAVRFLTISPGSSERITLDISPQNWELIVDESAEQEMVSLVNRERTKRGLEQLVVDGKIVAAARAHSLDMFQRRYFAHENPEGEDAVDRMQKAGVSFRVGGENLAFSADVETAHEGLMESEGHRKNILDPAFGRIGVGVIDSGIYGRMFTQNFAD